MKYLTITLFFVLMNYGLHSQSNNIWIAFWNSDTTKIGFKDKYGNVKIKPIFKGVTIANKFENIIAVTEEVNEEWINYYLTKNGTKVGQDSLYFFDNTADCESEDFIRFHDNITDEVGILNRNGNIVIPAIYNELTKVNNGMIVGLKGAIKKIDKGGEHYSWVGGNSILIDTNNNVLINNFKYDNNINLSSIEVSSKPNKDSIRENFMGLNGKYYSFINFEKEFTTWLHHSFLAAFTRNLLLASSFKTISFWKKNKGWLSKPKTNFISNNFPVLQSKLLELKSPKCDYQVFSGSLNQFIYSSPAFDYFYNNCGESKDWIYPVQQIVISHKLNGKLIQDNFEFLRTDNGYKLISVAFGGEDRIR